MEQAIRVTEWSLERGWDEEKGGIFLFRRSCRKARAQPGLSRLFDMLRRGERFVF